MNGWDLLTWLSSVALAASAVVIFVFFLRDARSIFTREMHHPDDEPTSSSGSGSPGGDGPEAPPKGR